MLLRSTEQPLQSSWTRWWSAYKNMLVFKKKIDVMANMNITYNYNRRKIITKTNKTKLHTCNIFRM